MELFSILVVIGLSLLAGWFYHLGGTGGAWWVKINYIKLKMNKLKLILVLFSLLLTWNCYYLTQKSYAVEVINSLVADFHVNSTAFNKEKDIEMSKYIIIVLDDKPGRLIGKKYNGHFLLIVCPLCKNKRWVRRDAFNSGITSGVCRKCACREVGRKNKNKHSWNYKKKWSKEHRNNLSKIHTQRLGGLTPMHKLIRENTNMKNWRKQVFKRDNYKCQNCKKHGGELNAHHIIPFNKILKEFLQKYNLFSLTEDKETLLKLAMTYKSFWDIENGITLCEKCHIIEHKNKK